MRAEDFELLYNLEERYWWFVAMRRITDTVMARDLERSGLRILDAGCGTGFNLGYYSAKHQVYGLDVAGEAVTGVRKRGFMRVTQASVAQIPFERESFDLVFSFDVVCQLPVDSHNEALREMNRVLAPGGALFIRVPAFEWLRSSHDQDLKTFHRFTRAELASQLRDSGFEVEWSSYANGFLFPVAVLRRLLKRLAIGKGTDVRPLPGALAWIDPVFRGILQSEGNVFRAGRSLPFGLSVICRARKLPRDPQASERIRTP